MTFRFFMTALLFSLSPRNFVHSFYSTLITTLRIIKSNVIIHLLLHYLTLFAQIWALSGRKCAGWLPLPKKQNASMPNFCRGDQKKYWRRSTKLAPAETCRFHISNSKLFANLTPKHAKFTAWPPFESCTWFVHFRRLFCSHFWDYFALVSCPLSSVAQCAFSTSSICHPFQCEIVLFWL